MYSNEIFLAVASMDLQLPGILFGKDLKDVTIEEAHCLRAARSPTNYSPILNPDRAKSRAIRHRPDVAEGKITVGW